MLTRTQVVNMGFGTHHHHLSLPIHRPLQELIPDEVENATMSATNSMYI